MLDDKNIKEPKKSFKTFGIVLGIIVVLIIFIVALASNDASQVNSERLNNQDSEVIDTQDLSNSEQTKKQTKINKYLEQAEYEKLCELYPELSPEEKTYFVGQLEKHFQQLIAQDQDRADETLVSWQVNLKPFTELNLESDLLFAMDYTLDSLEQYLTVYDDLASVYGGAIPSNATPQDLNIYISYRVGDSKNEGEYLDYYGAYTRYNYMYDGDTYPDTDSEMIIIKSEQPLSEGVNYLQAVEDGTYDTISGNGFEHTNRLFITYSNEEWEKYYQAQNIEAQKAGLGQAIETITWTVLDDLAKGEIELAQETLANIIAEYNSSNLVGQWWDSYSQRCHLTIDYNEGTYYIEVNWSSSASENTTWSFTGTYNNDLQGIAYSNGVCKETYYGDNGEFRETVRYSDGQGLFYLSDGSLYWKDEKEDAGQDCIFQK